MTTGSAYCSNLDLRRPLVTAFGHRPGALPLAFRIPGQRRLSQKLAIRRQPSLSDPISVA